MQGWVQPREGGEFPVESLPPTPTRVPSSVRDNDRHCLPTMPISFPWVQLISWMCSLVNGSNKSTQRCPGLS